MRIVWSNASKRHYLKTIEYLEDTWGEGVVEGFREKVKKATQLICQSPKTFPYSEEIAAHKCLVTKHNIIVYTFTEEVVYILAFVDTRSDHAY
jgi:plasmid stabilization system protein ParE